MNYKKYLLFTISIVFFSIVFGGNIYSYVISDIDITDDITNATPSSIAYTVSGTLADTEGIIDYLLPLKISSSLVSDFDFNADVSGTSFTAYFYVDLNAEIPSYDLQYTNRPIIPSETIDTITIEDNNSQGFSDSIEIDAINPIIGTFTITSLGTTSNNYYRGDVNLVASGYSDVDSYLSKYIAYIVTSSNISNYSSSYTKRIQKDTNISPINLGIGTGLVDGNYYVLLDTQDAAGNNGSSQNVIDTNKLLLIDNTKPSITSFNLGTLTDGNTYYVDSNTFIINIVISESGSGIDTLQAATKMVITLPDTTTVVKDYNLTNLGFYHSQTGTWTDSNIYRIAIDVNDLVDNNLSIDFNIIIDTNAPTTPSKPTLTRAVDDNITIASWGASTDSGSGLLEYRVYRSTSTFTSYTNQTLICSVLPTATKSCLDSTDKSMDTTYYYGVAAVDKAGNLSSIDTNSISTGPSLSFEIDDDNTYTNKTNPIFTINTSSDVNAIRFSCNASTFTSWIEITDNTDFNYTQFNITSGNGCSTTNETKTIYIEARSEDSPYTITRKSNTIKYDSIAPDIPSLIVVTNQSTGNIYLSWSDSEDNNSGLSHYRVYYSTTSTVSLTSTNEIAEDNYFSYNPNEDINVYFKITSVDNAGNESSLSSLVVGTSKRFGPSFTIILSPVNDVNGIHYLKSGLVHIRAISDEDLSGVGQIKIKIGTSSYVSVPASTQLREISGDYNITTSGIGVIQISGRNLSSELATDEFDFTSDVNLPIFDFNYSITQSTLYELSISNYSSDIYRVEYLFNDVDQLCLIEKNGLADYNCDFNTVNYSDGNHAVKALVYDNALNITSKEIAIIIDNVNEIIYQREQLIAKINLDIDTINSRLETYSQLLIEVSPEVAEKLEQANKKITDAEALVGVDEIAVNENYTQANNLLTEILAVLPQETIIKTRTITKVYDLNSGIDFSASTYDANVIKDTNSLYSSVSISVDRNFTIVEINAQKYYLVVLEFKNSSSQDQIITFVEEIPKELASTISDLIFSDKVNVLDSDPLINYSITVPANSSKIVRYNKKSPITDFDMLTKFEGINFKYPVVLSGNLTTDKIKFVQSGVQSKFLVTIGIIVLILIVILFLVWFIVSKSKNKIPELGKPSVQSEIYGVLGNSTIEQPDSTNLNKSNESTDSSSESKIVVDDKFQSNYDYILDAVKRSNRDNK